MQFITTLQHFLRQHSDSKVRFVEYDSNDNVYIVYVSNFKMLDIKNIKIGFFKGIFRDINDLPKVKYSIKIHIWNLYVKYINNNLVIKLLTSYGRLIKNFSCKNYLEANYVIDYINMSVGKIMNDQLNMYRICRNN